MVVAQKYFIQKKVKSNLYIYLYYNNEDKDLNVIGQKNNKGK